MTENKTLKRRVRARMSKTGESYTAARRQVTAKRDRDRVARTRLASTDDRPSVAAIREATGKTWDRWFSILDAWGAKDMKHPDIVRRLTGALGVPGWWAQAITVWYERSRGMRLKYQRSDGFSVSVSKTIAVPVEVLFEAFVDDLERMRWLGDGSLSLRTALPTRSARFDWEDGTTRVNAGFEAKGPSKSMVAVEHARLADAEDTETAKAAWKQRLADLKACLES